MADHRGDRVNDLNGRAQVLLSLPARLAHDFAELEQRHLPDWVPACDPPSGFLGSGGGTTPSALSVLSRRLELGPGQATGAANVTAPVC